MARAELMRVRAKVPRRKLWQGLFGKLDGLRRAPQQCQEAAEDHHQLQAQRITLRRRWQGPEHPQLIFRHLFGEIGLAEHQIDPQAMDSQAWAGLDGCLGR